MQQPAIISRLLCRPVEFRDLLDQLPLGVVVTNLKKRLVCINQTVEVLVGLTREDVCGLPCNLVLRTNLCATNCPLDQIVDNQTQFAEGNIINEQRNKVPVRVSVSALTDRNGTKVGYLSIIEDISRLKEVSGSKGPDLKTEKMIGHCPQIERIYQILPGIAETDSSVLITGETGTGKDILAEVIHDNSNRSQGAFVKVNCGALPETLLESELFGHIKGAFTGASTNKPGRFKLAHKGSLFLTEVGDLPLDLQVKLLSFLDDRIIYPLGSTKGIPVDVRIIGATHRDLRSMVENGHFRKDLLYRLNVVRVHLPPLRERGDDIRLLLDHFLHTYSRRFKKPIKCFASQPLSYLLAYPYPGNVRELKNIVEYAVNICPGEKIQFEHLPSYLLETQETTPSQESRKEVGPPEINAEEPDLIEGQEPSSWGEVERKMILNALRQAKGRKGEAAKLLGWGRSTLWRKMKQYEIE